MMEAAGVVVASPVGKTSNRVGFGDRVSTTWRAEGYGSAAELCLAAPGEAGSAAATALSMATKVAARYKEAGWTAAAPAAAVEGVAAET